MSDATYSDPPNDTITAVDLLRTIIDWQNQVAFIFLRETWQSGKITDRQVQTQPADAQSFAQAWMQATPKKKLLNWLVTNYVPDLVISTTLNA